MKIKKLDRRHFGYSSGWRYAMQFTKREWKEQAQSPYAVALRNKFGEDMTLNPERNPLSLSNYWLFNDHWRLDTKRLRIYVKTESTITLATLML